jgi:glycerol-3-phosphate cytidylyltransferase-like family protein
VRHAASKIAGPEETAAAVASARAGGKRVAVAAGRFALLHHPWIEALSATRAEADVLVVIVRADRAGVTPATMPASDRALLVAALRDVDHVLLAPDEDVPALLARLKPDVSFPREAETEAETERLLGRLRP